MPRTADRSADDPSGSTREEHEEDGATLDYTRGDLSRTQVTAEQESHRTRVHINPAQGSYPGQPTTRQVELILYRAKAPSHARINGLSSQDWNYDPHKGETRIRLTCSVLEGAIIDILEQS